MAITNAQQYQQLVNKPGNGKRPGYKGGADMGTVDAKDSKGNVTRAATNKASDLNVGAGGASFNDNDTPQSLNVPSSNYVSPVTGTVDPTGKEKFKYDKQFYDKGDLSPSQSRLNAIQKHNIQKRINYRRRLMDNNLKLLEGANVDNALSIEDFGPEGTGKYSQEFIDAVLSGERPPPQFFNEIDPNAIPTLAGKGIATVANFFGKKMAGPVTQEEIDRIMKEQVDLENFDPTKTTFDDMMKTYEPNRYARENDLVYNRITGQFTPKPNDGGGGNQQQTDPCLGPNPPAYCAVNNDPTDPATPSRNLGGLAARIAGSEFDFTGLADGGRAGMMDGGMMEDTPEGGIMDLESGRQMYFLGKLVKKATRAVKKVVKSPIGKMALGYALTGGLGNLAGGSGFGGMFKGFMSPTKFLGKSKLAGIFSKGGAKNILGSVGDLSLGKKLGLGFGIPFALDALGVGKEEEDNSAYEKYMKDMRLDIPGLRGRRNLAAAFDGSTYDYEAYADGGRTGYQEGGDAEPVAKKTMPLLDMDGMEKDYREDGGFVPIGRMERADDVPARLSKNEFVFTADAVRNAGEGDIDKGAEVMYNMMKNLESGGEVSEESQGLNGAREMFKTSQRLEEVL